MVKREPTQEKANTRRIDPGGFLKNLPEYISSLNPLVTLAIGVIGTLIAIYGVTPDFHVSVTPMSGETVPSGNLISTISIDKKYPMFFNYKELIYLSTSVLPPNVNATFNRIPNAANFRSLMNIRADHNATPGNYEITIRAIGCDGIEHIGKYFLTIGHN